MTGTTSIRPYKEICHFAWKFEMDIKQNSATLPICCCNIVIDLMVSQLLADTHILHRDLQFSDEFFPQIARGRGMMMTKKAVLLVDHLLCGKRTGILVWPGIAGSWNANKDRHLNTGLGFIGTQLTGRTTNTILTAG